MDDSQEMQVVFAYSEEWKMFMERLTPACS
jgi:hypothetical protein